MDSNELIIRLGEYGADIDGINARFAGDAELFEDCFKEFINERNFENLSSALSSGDYSAAFDASHALKGLSGNLGLTPFYKSVCVLTDILRQKSYSPDIEAAYENMLHEKKRLEAVYAGKSDIAEQKREEPAGQAAGHSRKRKKKYKSILSQKNRVITTAVAVLLAVISVFYLLFSNLVKNYRANTIEESAGHLIEMNYQLKLYIEERVKNDWRATYSIANSVLKSNYEKDDAVFEIIVSEQKIWNVSDILVYSEDGYSYNSYRQAVKDASASETIAKAKNEGEYMAIVNSTICNVLPLETELKINGSKIVAISVVRNVETFLDRMGFSSFDGEAYIYMTGINGSVLSRLSHREATEFYNITSYLKDKNPRTLSGDTMPIDNILNSNKPMTFFITEKGINKYVVSTPLFTDHGKLRLFYFVPEKVVNRTTDGFSSYITVLSIAVISIFTVCAAILFLLFYNIRKRKFDKELLARERMFSLLVENTKTAFALFEVNRDEPLFLSGNADTVTGVKIISVKHSDDIYRFKSDSESDAVRQLNAELEVWDGKSEFRSGFIRNPSSETERYFAIQLYPIDLNGLEIVAIAQDVTRPYRREDAVRKALEMAENANMAKSRFLSNMSHDIRTPMNAIVNMTDFALDSIGEPGPQREYLKTIKSSSSHLLRLINNVLDMSRIESGQYVIGSDVLDLREEMQKLKEIVLPLCLEKNQTFISDFENIGCTSIVGDSLKLSQILMNLLSNAVKFTPPGGAVRFIVSEIPSLSDDLCAVRFIVEDNGIGIPESKISDIFEPFTRVDDNRVSKIEGTGLGLSICKSYVNAMGGTIKCESEEDNGSVFTVELAFKKAMEAEKEKPSAMSWEKLPFLGKRCLLCEDIPTNQKKAKTMLENIGFMVELADDGQEGLAKFSLSKEGYYDVIYMDIQMPHLDGYQATAAIRESNHPGAKTIPIIALTANVFAEDIEKARAAGMNGHIGKPIMVLNLLDETYRALSDNNDNIN